LAKKSKRSTRPAVRTKASKAKAPKAKTSRGAAKAAPAKRAAKAAPAAKKTAKKPAKSAAKPAKATKPAKSAKPARPVATTSPTPVVRPALQPSPFAATATVADFASLPIEQLRKVKSGLSAKDIAHFRQLLLEKRTELVGDVKSMHDGARQASGGNLSHMPVHMADIGSDNYDQEFTLGLVESEAKLLREIDEALIRIREGYYGVCMVTGKPIVRARLEAKPWAKYSIEVAREMEKRGLR
jgi:DnaK suppressor protein